MGNISKIFRKGKVVTEYIRDDTGKVTGIKDALGRVKKVEMDNKGNITADYAPDGSCTKYGYDKFNCRVSQTDGNGNKTTFAYDPAGRLILQANPLGETINWYYDDQGRLLTKTTAEQTIKNTYDADNHLRVIDYGSGQTINYEYDDQDRVVSAVSSQATAPQAVAPQAATDQPVTDYRTVLRMLMKAGGHMTDKATATAPQVATAHQVATASQVATYCNYDSLGRVDAIRYVNGQDEQLVRFRYDPSGQRTGLLLAHLRPAVASVGAQVGKDAQYDILQQTEYGYDGSGRLSSITSCGQPVVAYQYDFQNRIIKKTFGNGMTADLSYDALGRLAGIAFSNGPISSPLTLAYEWDAANQVTRRTWDGETQRYEYTPAGHLAKVVDDKSGAILEAYAYDKAGNMIEKTLNGQKTTLSYNAANELTSSTGPSGSMSYSYDKAGRMVGNGTVTNAYGWLDKVIKTTSATGALIAMTYWPDGQLAAEGPASVTNKAAYDPNQPGTESFLWDGLALLRRGDTVYVTEPHPNGGTVIASHPIGQTAEITYYLNDLLGTNLASIKNGGMEFNNLTTFGELPNNTSGQPVNLSPNTIAPPSNPLPKTQQISPTGN
ncbi:MAG: hypothetical protein LV481_14850 [Methylacidiphilales bacterium]|nr:hypothetical protein [Candidatus Methylacidiphilales bacterium]